jgi:hypothetical protein
LAPSYFLTTPTNTVLSFTEEYWLNMDPTQTNNLIFRNTKIDPSDPNGLWLTLEMATIDGLGQTNKLEILRGDSAISIWALENMWPAWRPFGQYWLSSRSFDDNYKSRTFINSYTNTTGVYFTWKLDVNDRRLTTTELINVPEPPPPPP